MGPTLWLPGTVVGHHVETATGQSVPYVIQLERGDSCYSHLDHSMLIRAAEGEELAWNDRTRALEVAAEASLLIHPSGNSLVIGMFTGPTATRRPARFPWKLSNCSTFSA